jgi:hypothetical protein
LIEEDDRGCLRNEGKHVYRSIPLGKGMTKYILTLLMLLQWNLSLDVSSLVCNEP